MTNTEPHTDASSINQALKQAIAHHQGGRLQTAEQIYRAIIDAQPDANHNLGVLAVQAGQPLAGLPHLKMALETNPSQSQYWISYVVALVQTGQIDAARQVLAQGRQHGLEGKTLDVLAEILKNHSGPEDRNSPNDGIAGLVPINIPNPLGIDEKILFQNELDRLSQSNNLELQLRHNDAQRPIKRIYVMGCGRSGTWLLTAVLSTFRDLLVVPDELPVEYFGLYSTTASTLAMKRSYNSFETVEKIPEQVQIAYIVRHPYDVLTSHNPTTDNKYHIAPHRWLGEMLALQYLVDTQRPNTRIIRYEDLAADPDGIQADLGAYFGLEINAAPENITSTFKPTPEAAAAMHGLRAIDRNSICKYKNDPEKIAYLKEILPRLGRTLAWMAEEFSYDISL